MLCCVLACHSRPPLPLAPFPSTPVRLSHGHQPTETRNDSGGGEGDSLPFHLTLLSPRSVRICICSVRICIMPQCPHLHLRPAQHRSGSSAHPDPDPQLLSFFTAATARQEWRFVKAHQRVRVLFQLPSFAQQKRSRLRNLDRMLHSGTIDFCAVIATDWAS